MYSLHVTSCASPALSSEYRDLYVPIAEDAVVRSLVMEPQQPSVPDKPPLVLVHGFGCGILQFYKNLDHLHADRRLFALDLPGFARSTRIPFPEEAQTVEAAFVSALERWREGVGLEQFVLLGHSLGGFLCLSYAMTYPHRIRHLILDDPWGFPERSTEPPPPSSPHPSTSSSPPRTRRMPAWARVGAVFMSKFNPLTPVRMAGPLGTYSQSLLALLMIIHEALYLLFHRAVCDDSFQARLGPAVWRRLYELHLPLCSSEPHVSIHLPSAYST